MYYLFDNVEKIKERCLNRRVPNGTHGGVRGQTGAWPSRPTRLIFLKIHALEQLYRVSIAMFQPNGCWTLTYIDR